MTGFVRAQPTLHARACREWQILSLRLHDARFIPQGLPRAAARARSSSFPDQKYLALDQDAVNRYRLFYLGNYGESALNSFAIAGSAALASFRMRP